MRDATLLSKRPFASLAAFAVSIAVTALFVYLSVSNRDGPEITPGTTPLARWTGNGSLNAPPIVISEFLANNVGGQEDEDGDTPDWIELYNRSDAPVNVKGWALSDEPRRWDTWRFPATTIGPGSYLVVFASGKNRRDPERPLHTNFRLDAAGEYLALFDAQGRAAPVNVFLPQYPRQTANVSFGRKHGQLTFLAPPTPGASSLEAESFEGVVAEVTFSRAHGFFDDGFHLSLRTRTREASIRYTLDGTAPSRSHGNEYREPIRVDRTSIVRAAAFRDRYISSGVGTQTYVFPEQVLRQARPPDYPETWGEGLPADYAMSASDDARTAEALLSIPSVSLVTDPAHLFDPEIGIYMNTENDGVDWERPVSVELIDPAGVESLRVDAGFRIQGRSSRKPHTSPKHSFRLLFKSQYGAGRMEYPVFGESGAPEFNTLVLRATSNHSWTFPLVEHRVRAQYVRDLWAKDSQRAMGHEAARCRYAHLYLNGLYWGLYSISERPDAAFMATYFGGEPEEYDVRKGGETVDGDERAWNTVFTIARQGLEHAENYEAIRELIDLDSFIDFMILNHYAGNQNWDYGNWYAARRRAPAGRFRFFVWDMESILGRIGENRVFVRNRDRPTELFHRLRENEAFRARFADRVRKHLTGSGALTPGPAAERFLRRAERIDLAIVAESARWGDYRAEKHPYRTGPFETYTREEHWLREQERLVEFYFPRRTSTVLEQYRRAGLYGQ